MKIIKILIASLVLLSFTSDKCYSQLFGFLVQTEKVALFTETNTGLLFTTGYGKGSEFAYGGGFEISPFKRFFYIKLAVKKVHQFTKDNSPSIDIFPNNPDAIKMKSKYLRAEYGLKIRLDWWFKQIDDEGAHFSIGFYKISDFYLKEKSDLHYASTTISESTNYSDYTFHGEFYEVGISWVFSDYFKWDSNLYAYYTQEGHSIIKNGFAYSPISKASIGINTGLFWLF